jgi:hypothetical protein
MNFLNGKEKKKSNNYDLWQKENIAWDYCG